MPRHHLEHHRLARSGWLRAAVLGANDGVISTASLVIGVAAAGQDHGHVLVAGLAGLTAGAFSMAAGEYVSVSSQADLEAADLARERAELNADPAGEHAELAGIYRARGLSADLADKVATAFMAHDPLAAHLRDELGMTEAAMARPMQASLASAGSFAAGAVVPVLVATLAPSGLASAAVTLASLASLALLGALSALTGSASPWRAMVRVLAWGALAMAASALIGRLVGGVVG